MDNRRPLFLFLRIVWNFERQATNWSSAGFQCRICEHQTSDQGNLGSHFLNGKCAIYANFLKCCCEEYKIKAQIIPRRHCTPPSAIHESSHVSFEEVNERKSVQRKDWSKLCRTVRWYCSSFDQFVYLRFFRFETLRHMYVTFLNANSQMVLILNIFERQYLPIRYNWQHFHSHHALNAANNMRVNLQIKDKKSSSLLFIYLCCVKEIYGIFAHHYCPWRSFLKYQDYSSYF